MIRALEISDIERLTSLKPLDWDFDFAAFVHHYIDDDFYYAFVLLEGGSVVGTGSAFVQGSTGWLANIIVHKNHRGKGYGRAMTEFLVEFMTKKGCETHLLIATDLGAPVYRRIGFQKVSEYLCFDFTLTGYQGPPNSIRRLQASDLEAVYQLDRAATDEDRLHLLNKYYDTALGYFGDTNDLLGFYLPDFARGLVVATTENAGIALLQLKHSRAGQRTMIPVKNKAGLAYLETVSQKTNVTALRMTLGKANKWKPTTIYSYAGGYCG